MMSFTKNYFRNTVIKSMIFFAMMLLGLPSASHATCPSGSSFCVDFRDATGSPTSDNNQFEIDNIHVDVATVSPLTGTTTTATTNYNVIWEFNYTDIVLGIASATIAGGTGGTGGTGGCMANLAVLVTDASTGSGISGATVGGVGSSATTNTNGVASFTSISAGSNVSVTVSAPGYESQSTSTFLECGADNQLSVALLSNTVAATGNIKIILTWGENPNDLDSHLTGPKTSGSTRFHVYFRAKNRSGTSSAGFTPSDSSIPALLDVDDISSFGPETITIAKVNGSFVAGTYRYTVHHFSGSSNIPNSSAVVKVYNGSTLLHTYTPPSSSTASSKSAWTVFEITISSSGSVSLTEVGTYADRPGSSSIPIQRLERLGVPIQSEDYNLFLGLPEK